MDTDTEAGVPQNLLKVRWDSINDMDVDPGNGWFQEGIPSVDADPEWLWERGIPFGLTMDIDSDELFMAPYELFLGNPLLWLY